MALPVANVPGAQGTASVRLRVGHANPGGQDVQFVMTSNHIDIRRISTANRKGSAGNQVKFN